MCSSDLAHALGCAPDIPQLPCPAYFPGTSNLSCSAGRLFGGTSVLPVLPQPQLWGLPLQINSHGDKGLIPGLLSLGSWAWGGTWLYLFLLPIRSSSPVLGPLLSGSAQRDPGSGLWFTWVCGSLPREPQSWCRQPCP